MHTASGRRMQVNESDKETGVFCGPSEDGMLDWPPRSCPELEMGDVKCTSLPFLLTQCGIEQQNILGLGSFISKIWDFNWVALNIPISLITFRFVTSRSNFGFSESICINWIPAERPEGT